MHAASAGEAPPEATLIVEEAGVQAANPLTIDLQAQTRIRAAPANG